ncbi:hypothetical protein Bca52824_061876 [Brassica carinata]|uniref:Uncharacterized protein n=1 Tax=Brassica carinata TaxID=52824 RepID=A0A8X7U8V6_BRACI|nr:hypothetical protein Bca52824_061876 [Brassica carinata]
MDPLLCDDELSNTPLAITDQSTAITEASSPLVDSDIVPLTDEESELSSNPPNAFIPSIGAWAKPLAFAHLLLHKHHHQLPSEKNTGHVDAYRGRRFESWECICIGDSGDNASYHNGDEMSC